ncbi:MAG: hypothetical protein CL840_08595 [Crocinitomicaceae bacterium]|nr:hypothetical protein [Crocinitomicaceae bacterium]|tara:strand:- start:16230 stop:17810 length:1581 start_codon:yes stop_codon:yes gene_type:complete
MKTTLTIISLSLSLVLLGQVKTDSNIVWSENHDKLNLRCELLVDEKGVLTKVFHGNDFLRIQKVDEENNVLMDKTYEFGRIVKGSLEEFVIKTNNFFILISKHRNYEREEFVYRHTRINSTSLEIEVHEEKLFSQDFVRHKNVDKIFYTVSPDESKFFIGHNKLTRKPLSRADYAFTFVGTVYDATANKIYSGEVDLEGHKDYVRNVQTLAQITNDGYVFFRHELKKKILQLTPQSSQIKQCGISEKILEFNASFHEINNIRVFNGNKNYVCFTYSEDRDRRFQTGIVICNFSQNGDCNVLTEFRIPKELTQIISNTRYEESRDCIRRTEREEVQLFNWKVSEFEKLDETFVLFLEYNHRSSSFSPYNMGSVFRDGELVVFQFNSDFSDYKYHIIPKLFASGCDLSNCAGLQSTANVAGYSMFNQNSKIMLFFWGNSNNEIHMIDTPTEERVIHHVPTMYKEKICMYSVEINNEQTRPKFYNMGSYLSSKYSLLLNHGVLHENYIYFRAHRRSSATGRFKLAKYPF